MNRRTALAALLTLAIAAAGAGLLLIILAARFLENDSDWLSDFVEAGPPDGLTPADLAALHEEARRITGEGP